MWSLSLGRQWKQGDEPFGERTVARERQQAVGLEPGERYAAIDGGDQDSTAYQRHGLGHVSWNELMTSDREAALAFYREQFGYEKAGAMDMGPEMGEYSFISHGGETVGAAMKASPEAPAAWQFYARVPDVDAAAGKITAGGGQVLFGPMEVPTGERVLVGVDPQGASFGLVSGGND